MGKKIFVSYKYADSNVRKITNNWYETDTVRDYVNKLENLIGKNDIYKGESDDNDLSQLTDDSIWNQLKQKIFDSSITIVLISPNMKSWLKEEKDQWIPQEISYSLKEITHNDSEKSKSNALLYVVIPDKTGSYDYFIEKDYFTNKEDFNYIKIFNIMKKNLNNYKYDETISYAIVVKWDTFIKNYSTYIENAVKNQANIDDYNICKQI